MKKLKESQLIINPDGSIYHLKLRPGQIADIVFLVGDPGRVGMVSRYFEKIELKVSNREMTTHTGYIGNLRLSVVSTGIGPDNIDIVVNELDALVNVDFKARKEGNVKKSLTLIRLGTSGTIQNDTEIDTIGLTTYAIGLDNLGYYYKGLPLVNKPEIVDNFLMVTKWPPHLPKPYIVQGNQELASRFNRVHYKGFTLTAPGFYGPQGRAIRLFPAFEAVNEHLKDFYYDRQRIINYEMESSALYLLSELLGHKAVTICAIVANRARETYSSNPENTVSNMIEMVIEEIISQS